MIISILFCISIVSAKDCTQTCNVCSKPPCTFCPGHLGYSPDLSASELIFEVYSPISVSSDPPKIRVSQFREIVPSLILHLSLVWPTSGSVGTIGLQNVDSDTIYGPWQASGYAGMDRKDAGHVRAVCNQQKSGKSICSFRRCPDYISHCVLSSSRQARTETSRAPASIKAAILPWPLQYK